MTTEAALPTEAMIVVGMEAMSCLRQTDEYKRMTGCQQGAESARVCWAAMVAEMHSGQPRQDRLPSDSEVVTAWAESHWATYDEDPAGVVKFARLLLQRYEQAVLQSPETQKRMEAYAAAKVREALEEAAKVAESCVCSCCCSDDQKFTAQDAAQRICALIPSTPA